jgi:Cu2+-exporting ATPase
MHLAERTACWPIARVTAVNINYTTRRARVRWDESRIKLSDILGAIAAIGYRAYPYDAAKNEEISNKERRGALWRLWVAGFGMMQVMMYAFPVYIADGDMSPDVESLMRWAACFLTIPVIFYSSAPFSEMRGGTSSCVVSAWMCR